MNIYIVGGDPFEKNSFIYFTGFILIWTYNLFINNFIQLEQVEEDPYKGIIKIWDFSRKDLIYGCKIELELLKRKIQEYI